MGTCMHAMCQLKGRSRKFQGRYKYKLSKTNTSFIPVLGYIGTKCFLHIIETSYLHGSFARRFSFLFLDHETMAETCSAIAIANGLSVG